MKTTLCLSFVVLGAASFLGCGGGGSGGGSAGVASVATQVAPGSTSGPSSTGSTRPAIAMDVKLAAAKPVVAVGDVVEVRLDAVAVAELYGAGLDLSYDPAVLELVGAKAGPLIPNAFAAAGLRGGKAGVVTAGVSTEGATRGGSGSGTVLVVEFKARARGATTVNPVEVILEDATGTPGQAPNIGPVNLTVQ